MSTIENMRHAQNQYFELIQAQDKELRYLIFSKGPESPNYIEDKNAADTAKEDLRVCKNRLGGRSPQILLETWWVFLLASSIVLVTEAFVNKVLFDMALLSNSLVSLAASALISAFLVFFAHVSGFYLRQIKSDYHRKFVWSKLIFGLLLALIVAILVLGIMYTRSYFDAQNLTGGGVTIFGEVVNKAFSEGYKNFVWQAFSTSESTIMGSVNFGALFGAFIIAMLSHDSDFEYDQRIRDFKKLDLKVKKNNFNFANDVKKIDEEHKNVLDNIKRAFVDAGGDPNTLPESDVYNRLEQNFWETEDENALNNSKTNPVIASVPNVIDEKVRWSDK